MDRITQDQFRTSMRGRQIDLAEARADARLSGVRVGRADLDGDGQIQGDAEVRRLFTEVDRLDRNGDAGSVDATDAAGRPTRAAQVADALQALSIPVRRRAPGASKTPAARGAARGQKMAEGGAASVRTESDAHFDAVAKTGIGLYYGDHSDYKAMSAAERKQYIADHTVSGAPVPDPKESSCIGWAMQHVKAAYENAGQGERWRQIEREVYANGSRGTDLAKALKADGWTSVYFNPDPRLPDDDNPEHPLTARQVASGKGYYGIKVDDTITGYRPTAGSKTVEDDSGIDRLKNVPFFFGLARGGDHTFVGTKDQVNEFHWDANPDEHRAIEERSLEEFPWNSGVIMVPPGQW